MFSTENPVIRLSASKMIKALMIKRKSPKVRMVTGKDRIIKIGLTIKFNKLKTTATIMAVV